MEQEVIRSRQNRGVVELCKLSDRKSREEAREFRLDGIKLLAEALEKGVTVKAVFLRESTARALAETVGARVGSDWHTRVERVLILSDEVFARISEEKSPEGVISIAKYIDKFQKIVTIYNSADFSAMAGERIVLLESVRDPSNIGAIIRSAAAMGVDRLILSRDCADIYHPRAVRASMGALFSQRMDRVEELPAVIAGLRASGRRVFAAALDENALVLGKFALREGDCVVIGNEGHGLSAAVLEASTANVMIPMSGRTESLNAAVAASLLMWEFCKQ